MTPELLKLSKKIIDGMVSYMKFGAAVDDNDPDYNPDFDAGYKQKDVDQCSKIINDFFNALTQVPDAQKNEYILKSVKVVVLRLNELNQGCGGSLIETGQREDLCDLIISSAQHAGLESDEDDITEEWREW